MKKATKSREQLAISFFPVSATRTVLRKRFLPTALKAPNPGPGYLPRKSPSRTALPDTGSVGGAIVKTSKRTFSVIAESIQNSTAETHNRIILSLPDHMYRTYDFVQQNMFTAGKKRPAKSVITAISSRQDSGTRPDSTIQQAKYTPILKPRIDFEQYRIIAAENSAHPLCASLDLPLLQAQTGAKQLGKVKGSYDRADNADQNNYFFREQGKTRCCDSNRIP